ncbi:MAG: hypothetical protein WA628_27055 [Terriglobales bacterium]
MTGIGGWDNHREDPSESLQPLAEMYAPVYNFETQRLMGALDPLRVRRHLNAALRTGPVFSRAHQFPAKPTISEGLVNEPAFHEANRSSWIAPVSLRSQSNFEEAHQCASLVV